MFARNLLQLSLIPRYLLGISSSFNFPECFESSLFTRLATYATHQDCEKNGNLVERWIEEKRGETEVNTLSCKRWTGVKEKGLSGIQVKGRSWQRWELGSNETSTSTALSNDSKRSTVFMDTRESSPCLFSRMSLVGRLQHERRFGSFREFESRSVLSSKWIFRIWIADRDYLRTRIDSNMKKKLILFWEINHLIQFNHN